MGTFLIAPRRAVLVLRGPLGGMKESWGDALAKCQVSYLLLIMLPVSVLTCFLFFQTRHGLGPAGSYTKWVESGWKKWDSAPSGGGGTGTLPWSSDRTNSRSRRP